VFVPLDPAAGYAMSPELIGKALTRRTRAIVVGSPANPTGAIQSEANIRGLAQLGVPLVSDEIYDGLVYDGAVFSALSCDSSDVFVLDGFSKRYAMTGFRLGWVVAPEDAMRPLQTLQQNLFISANRFVQHAGIAALANGESTVTAMQAAYRRRRDRLVRGLRELGFRVPAPPPGAFYVFADARAFGSDSRQLAFDILERAHVGVTPGIDFGEAGEGWLRLCFAASDETLNEALERLARVLPELG
jgi:aspartate/methionine/tyrosine aminotransferase